MRTSAADRCSPNRVKPQEHFGRAPRGRGRMLVAKIFGVRSCGARAFRLSVNWSLVSLLATGLSYLETHQFGHQGPLSAELALQRERDIWKRSYSSRAMSSCTSVQTHTPSMSRLLMYTCHIDRTREGKGNQWLHQVALFLFAVAEQARSPYE